MIARERIPNLLTFARIAAVPVSLLIILTNPAQHVLLFLVFGAAAATDFFDGYLARKWGVASPIGALLDPIADKLLVILMLLHLMVYYGLSLVPVAAIILREIYISGLREYLASKQVALPVSSGGKLKTGLQLTGILWMLGSPMLGWEFIGWAGSKVLWLAAAVAVITAVDYTKKSWPHLTSPSGEV